MVVLVFEEPAAPEPDQIFEENADVGPGTEEGEQVEEPFDEEAALAAEEEGVTEGLEEDEGKDEDEEKDEFDLEQPDDEPEDEDEEAEKDEDEDDEEDFDDDEDIGEKPTTAKTVFDPTTLWRLKELKAKIKVTREQTQPIFEEEEIPETP